MSRRKDVSLISNRFSYFIKAYDEHFKFSTLALSATAQWFVED